MLKLDGEITKTNYSKKDDTLKNARASYFNRFRGFSDISSPEQMRKRCSGTTRAHEGESLTISNFETLEKSRRKTICPIVNIFESFRFLPYLPNVSHNVSFSCYCRNDFSNF